MLNRTTACKGLIHWLVLLGCTFMLLGSGCASKKQPPPEEQADIFVSQAMKDFDRGNYYEARETFQKVKDQFPFSRHSLLAELKLADCNFYLRDFKEALALYEEFEKNHPSNENTPYVIFQIGRCHYKMIDTIDRDPSGASKGIQAFSRLLKTYPDSPYTEEAQVIIKRAQEFLARHELYVARFYARTDEFEQAVGRLEYLIDHYPQSAVVERARQLLEEVRAELAREQAKGGKKRTAGPQGSAPNPPMDGSADGP